MSAEEPGSSEDERGFLSFFLNINKKKRKDDSHNGDKPNKKKREKDDLDTRIRESDNTNEIIELLKTKDEQNETDMSNIGEDIAKIIFEYGENRNVMLYITTHGGCYDLRNAANVNGRLLRSDTMKLNASSHFIDLNSQPMETSKTDLAAAENLAYLNEKAAKEGLELMVKCNGSNCQEVIESIKDGHLNSYTETYGKEEEAERSRNIQEKRHSVPNKQLRWRSMYHFHKEVATRGGHYGDQYKYDNVLKLKRYIHDSERNQDDSERNQDDSVRYLDDLFLVVPQEDNQTKYYKLTYILQYIHQVFPNLKKLMKEKGYGCEYEYIMKMSDLLEFVDLITGIGTDKKLYVYDAACNMSGYMTFLLNPKAQYHEYFGFKGGSKKTYKRKTAKNINSKTKKVKVKKVKTRKKLKCKC